MPLSFLTKNMYFVRTCKVFVEVLFNFTQAYIFAMMITTFFSSFYMFILCVIICFPMTLFHPWTDYLFIFATVAIQYISLPINTAISNLIWISHTIFYIFSLVCFSYKCVLKSKKNRKAAENYVSFESALFWRILLCRNIAPHKPIGQVFSSMNRIPPE